MFWAAVSKNPEQAKTCRKSSRFCDVHDPGNPRSKYRSDLRYKAAFNRELQATCGFEKSSFSIELPGPRHSDEGMWRRLAYDRVHAGMRSYNSEAPSLIERVWTMHLDGQKQASIARALGISRPEVCRIMRRRRKIWNDHLLRLQTYLED